MVFRPPLPIPSTPHFDDSGKPSIQKSQWLTAVDNMFGSFNGATSGSVLANTGTTTGMPAPTTLTALLDSVFGTGEGSILVRATTSWNALALGATSTVLTSNGTDLVYGTVTQSSPLSTDIFRVLSADTIGSNTASAQQWFPGGGAASVLGVTTYLFAGQIYVVRSSGVTAHTTGVLFGGSATITSINYLAECYQSTVGNSFSTPGGLRGDSAAVVTVAQSDNTTSENLLINVSGIVRITTGGTFIPQFQYSAAPGGAPTIKANSFFYLRNIGSNTVTSQGTWT